jgi:hypothetical protein
MKIVILFLPRSASTTYVHQLSKETGIKNYNEAFGKWNSNNFRDNMLKQNSFIVKVNPEQFEDYKETIQSIDAEFRILEPRNYLETVTSYILPATMMRYSPSLERDSLWNIHWDNITSEEMRKRYTGHLIKTEHAIETMHEYNKIVDSFIFQIKNFDNAFTVIPRSEIKTSHGKIWNDLEEKLQHFENPKVVVEQIHKIFSKKWKEINCVLNIKLKVENQ